MKKMTSRWVLIIPDAGPINSLWVADEMSLLLKLDMQIVVLDEVYVELTSNPDSHRKDREVKKFIKAHSDVIKIEKTTVGRLAGDARKRGEDLTGQGLGEAAIAEFFSHGIEKYVRGDQPVLLLFEDADIRSMRVLRKSPNVHLLSTLAMLKGLEKVGLIKSAAEIIRAMTHQTDTDTVR